MEYEQFKVLLNQIFVGLPDSPEKKALESLLEELPKLDYEKQLLAVRNLLISTVQSLIRKGFALHVLKSLTLHVINERITLDVKVRIEILEHLLTFTTEEIILRNSPLFNPINVPDIPQNSQAIMVREEIRMGKERLENYVKWVNEKRNELSPKNPSSKPESQMQHFHKFINEVQTIEIKVKEYYVEDGKMFLRWTPDEVPDYNLKKQKFLDLSHYHQRKSDYETELQSLQQLAVSDAMNLSIEQLNRHLSRIEFLKKKYDQFWDLYKDYLKNPSKSTLFEHEVFNLFIISKPPKPSPNGRYSPSYSYARDWHDAIMFKQAYLIGLEKQIKKVLGMEETNPEQPKEGEVSPTQQTGTKPEFSLKELALMLQYEGQKITRINANTIAKDKGHNSGEKLFQLFTRYSSRQNRIGKETTPQKTQNKLNLFEKIIPSLSAEAKQRATDEMNTLKAAINKGDA